MSNTDNIRKMYSKITAPEDAIKNCLTIESEKVVKFPAKRVIAIAACVAVLLAVAVPVGANKILSGFDAVDKYGEQYPQKTDFKLNEISGSSLLVTEGDKLTALHQGLEISVEEAYFDGAFMYISFAGNYNGEHSNIDRFFYEGFDEYIRIDNEPQKAELTGYSFSLFENEGSFAGVLGFIYPYDKENLEVEINIPYLQVLKDGTMEVMDTIKESFSFNFSVKKSFPDLLVYNSENSREEVSVVGVTSSLGGVAVEIFVPEEVEVSKAGVVAAVTDSQGKGLNFILGNREKTEGGYIHKHYFEPTDSNVIDVIVYDKNDTDGCGNSPCVLAELKNVELKTAD